VGQRAEDLGGPIRVSETPAQSWGGVMTVIIKDSPFRILREGTRPLARTIPEVTCALNRHSN
jgi:hypothetical protein